MISLTLPEGQIENIERVHERAKGREGNGDPRVWKIRKAWKTSYRNNGE